MCAIVVVLRLTATTSWAVPVDSRPTEHRGDATVALEGGAINSNGASALGSSEGPAEGVTVEVHVFPPDSFPWDSSFAVAARLPSVRFCNGATVSDARLGSVRAGCPRPVSLACRACLARHWKSSSCGLYPLCSCCDAGVALTLCTNIYSLAVSSAKISAPGSLSSSSCSSWLCYFSLRVSLSDSS